MVHAAGQQVVEIGTAAVADDHGVHVGLADQLGEHPHGHLDRDRPRDLRTGLTVAESVGEVDHADEVGPVGRSELRCERVDFQPQGHRSPGGTR